MNTHISNWDRKTFVVALTLLFLLAGCYAPQSPIVRGTPPPFSCDNFTASYWQEFRFGEDSPENVGANITRLWEIDKDQVHIPSAELSEDVRMYWSKQIDGEEGVRYRAIFRLDRQLTRIEARWSRSRLPPTLAQVIDCLGSPQYYESVYTYGAGEAPRRLVLGLWYTAKGLVVYHTSFHNRVDRLPAIHPNQWMDSFIVVAPGVPEQMVPNVHTGGDNLEIDAYGLCVLKPWPGSIEAMEVEWGFGEDARCVTVLGALP